MNKEPLLSVIIPFKNEAKTIPIALDSLERQVVDFNFEVILADGCSTDTSVEVIKNHPLNKKATVTVLPLPKDNHGMTVGRNRAAEIAKGKFLLFMQSDVRVRDTDALSNTIKAFDDPKIVGTYFTGLSADEEFHRYDFWGKVMMIRYKGAVVTSDFDTKFNAVRTETYQQMGGFDEERFGWGGEDFDFLSRLLKHGEIFETGIEVEHLHALDQKQTALGIYRKYCRNAEVMGATFRVYINNPNTHPAILQQKLKELIICLLDIACLVPYTWPWSWIALFIMGIAWQARSYIHIRDGRLIYLPFFSAGTMFMFGFYFLRGLIRNKTSVRINTR